MFIKLFSSSLLCNFYIILFLTNFPMKHISSCFPTYLLVGSVSTYYIFNEGHFSFLVPRFFCRFYTGLYLVTGDHNLAGWQISKFLLYSTYSFFFSFSSSSFSIHKSIKKDYEVKNQDSRTKNIGDSIQVSKDIVQSFCES